MQKLILMMVFMMITLKAFSPAPKQFFIAQPEKVFVFDPMLYAFQKVESNFDPYVVNSLGYGGILQIGQEMIDEANRINALRGSSIRFILNDRFDVSKATQIWYIVQSYWNPRYSLKRAATLWNPLASINYYNKIKEVYDEVRRFD